MTIASPAEMIVTHGWSLPSFGKAAAFSCVSDLECADCSVDYTISIEPDGSHLCRFGDSATFRVWLGEQKVELLSSSTPGEIATLNHLLYDQLLPRLLSASCALVLHGSVIRMGGSLAIFIGETGAGKSTLAASLNACGHELLGDDAVKITASGTAFEGTSVYPSLRLYPDSIAKVLEDGIGTAPMAHYSYKRLVTGFRHASGADTPLPLGQIFLLADGEGVSLRRLSERESCMAMVDNSFALDPADIGAAKERFLQAVKLASAVPAYELCYPHDYDVLPEVIRQIEACVAGKSDEAC